MTIVAVVVKSNALLSYGSWWSGWSAHLLLGLAWVDSWTVLKVSGVDTWTHSRIIARTRGTCCGLGSDFLQTVYIQHRLTLEPSLDR